MYVLVTIDIVTIFKNILEIITYTTIFKNIMEIIYLNIVFFFIFCLFPFISIVAKNRIFKHFNDLMFNVIRSRPKESRERESWVTTDTK